jgi:hypothetical protein
MELKEFVSQTLSQIIEGVKNAQDKSSELGGIVNPFLSDIADRSKIIGHTYLRPDTKPQPVFPVEFDVAISTTDTTGSTAGGGIFVGAFGAGVKGQDSSSNAQVNRIRFFVPVSLPEPPKKA